MTINDAIALETIDYIGVTRLQHAYADVVNRRAWAEFDDLFRPDATVVLDLGSRDPFELAGPAAVGEFIGGAISRFDFFEFVILTTRVFLAHEGDPDQASARVYMQEIRHDAASGQYTTAYGLYRDLYRRIDQRWWIASRRYASLARSGPELHVIPRSPADLV
jgi:SnoaL-like domain